MHLHNYQGCNCKCVTIKQSEQSRDLARISKLPIFLNNSDCPKLSKIAKMSLNCVKWSKIIIFLSKKTGRRVASEVPGEERLPKLFGGVFVTFLIYFNLDFDLTWLLQEWWDFSRYIILKICSKDLHSMPISSLFLTKKMRKVLHTL